MPRLWLVAANEYRRNVFKRGFIFALLSVPLIMSLTVGVVVVLVNLENNFDPVGYVDHAGVLSEAIPVPLKRAQKPIEFVAYPTDEAGRAALDAGDIQLLYIIPTNYNQTGQVDLLYTDKPADNATSRFRSFLKVNLLAGQPEAIARRVTEGTSIAIHPPNSNREYSSDGPTLGQVAPLVLAFAFVFLLLMSTGYLVQAVTEEKENRTMEVLITSVSPGQMIVGKVMGILAITLTQFVVWILFAVIAVVVVANTTSIPWFQNLQLEWGAFGIVLLVGLPSYVLSASLMIAIGATVTKAQEGQSFGGMFSILYYVPLWLFGVLANHPNGPVAIILSLMPFSSLMAISTRNLLSVVPAWQIALTVVIQISLAVGAVWVAVRAFRLGMLRYGQRIKLRELFGRGAAVRAAAGSEGGAA